MSDDPYKRAGKLAHEVFRALESIPALKVFPDLQITASPVEPHASTYEFVFRNTGSDVLYKIDVWLYSALGPNDFGLDDAHMPSSLTHEPQVEIDRLGPGEEFKVVRKRWGPLSRYHGPSCKQLGASIAKGTNVESQRYFVNITIHG